MMLHCCRRPSVGAAVDPCWAVHRAADCQSRESAPIDLAAALARAFAEIVVAHLVDMASVDSLAAAGEASDILAVASDRSWSCWRGAEVAEDRGTEKVICTWEFDLDRDKVDSDKFVDMGRAHTERMAACRAEEVASAALDRPEVDWIAVQVGPVAQCWARLAVECRWNLPRVTSD